MTTVLVTQTFEAWMAGQTEQVRTQLAVSIGLLGVMGLQLRHPHSSSIKGASFALRELRPAAGRSAALAFYAFDPERAAVVLCGGSKNDSGDMYDAAIRIAEAEWSAHLALMATKNRKTPGAPAKEKKKRKK
jgi:hypothetical protein